MAERGKRDWADLPTELLSVIFSKLGVTELLQSVDAVCRAWRQVSLHPQFYRTIHIVSSDVDAISVENLARKAIRRSTDIVENFVAINCGTDELLSYIAHRTSRLKRIVLVMPRSITGTGIAHFIRKCPLLEECLVTCNCADYIASGDIGQVCPEMKSFRLTRVSSAGSYLADNEAREIAECMPLLRKLRLHGSMVHTVGLHAILDNCIHLESLEIGFSSGSLGGSLQAKLAKVKTVRFLECL